MLCCIFQSLKDVISLKSSNGTFSRTDMLGSKHGLREHQQSPFYTLLSTDVTRANPHAGSGSLLGNPKCVETERGAERNVHAHTHTHTYGEKKPKICLGRLLYIINMQHFTNPSTVDNNFITVIKV